MMLRPSLEPGDRAPPFKLPGLDREPVSPLDDWYAGRPGILVFMPTEPVSDKLFDTLSGAAASWVSASLFLVAPPAWSHLWDKAEAAGFQVLIDEESRLKRSIFGPVGDDIAVLVVDLNYRIVAVLSGSNPELLLETVQAAVEQAGHLPSGAHAPVLILPRLLSREECQHLIDEWHRPMKTWQSDGLASRGYDKEKTTFKVRVDTYGRLTQLIVRDAALEARLDRAVLHRLAPEIGKGFQSRADRREDYRVACYVAAEGGYLGPHRDNPSPTTRHRRFTVSVTLNGEGFEGGDLVFPEYSPKGYRLETGDAILWSCALLHEVRPVTSGRRFILGTHLYAGPPKR